MKAPDALHSLDRADLPYHVSRNIPLTLIDGRFDVYFFNAKPAADKFAAKLAGPVRHLNLPHCGLSGVAVPAA